MAVTQTVGVVPNLKEIQEVAWELYEVHGQNGKINRRVHDQIRFARLDQEPGHAYISEQGVIYPEMDERTRYWVTPDRKLKIRLADHWFLVMAEVPLSLDEKAITLFLRDILHLKKIESPLAVIGSVVDAESSPELQERLLEFLKSDGIVNSFEHGALKLTIIRDNRRLEAIADLGYGKCVTIGTFSNSSSVSDLLGRLKLAAHDAIT